MNEGLNKNENFSSKEKLFKEKLAYFSQIGDALGKGIEPGILEQVTYLSLLGFTTTSSCEGHVDGHGYPFGYIFFGSEKENDFNSVGNRVMNEVRAKAFLLEKDRFPDFDGTSGTHTPEIDDFFDKNMDEGLRSHPLYGEYLKGVAENNRLTQLEKPKIYSIVEEFKKTFPEYQQDIYIDPDLAMPNIYFTSKMCYELFRDDKEFGNNEEREINDKSRKTMVLFNTFLKEKFENKVNL